MSKERFDASKLTRKDMELIDGALCVYYGSKYTGNKPKKILLVKRKVEWLLTYLNRDEKKGGTSEKD